jgi:hypothetical protein
MDTSVASESLIATVRTAAGGEILRRSSLLRREHRTADEFHPAVLIASFLGTIVGDRLGFAVSPDYKLVRVETVILDQRLAHGFGPLY